MRVFKAGQGDPDQIGTLNAPATFELVRSLATFP